MYPRQKTNKYVLAVLGFYLLCYIVPLGFRDLCVPDETRYAEIPMEMIAGGDWISPRFDGVRYFEKPVLGYWATALSILAFGENNFAVRLPCALAAGLSALLVFLLARRAYGKKEQDETTAILAALVFLSCMEVFVVGNIALLDNLFSFFLTASIVAFFLATEATSGSAKEKYFLLASGASCGLAFLTKGFLAFAVPVLALAPYLAWQRRYRDLLRMGWLPILAAVAVALPWCISIHLREPDFWKFFFWNEHIRRFLGNNAQHKESFLFFFLAAPGIFLPWTFATPAAFKGIKALWHDPGEKGRLARLSICWLVLPYLFLSVSNGKLLTYVLPCFPPFAILTALGLSHVLEKEKESVFFRWGALGCAFFFGLLAVAFLYFQMFGYKDVRLFSHPWKSVMAVNGFVFMILLFLWTSKCSAERDKILMFGLAPLLLFFVVHFIVPEPTVEAKAPGPFLEKYGPFVKGDDIVVSEGNTVGAACWYWGRRDVFVLGNSGEFDYGLKSEDAQGRLLDEQSAAELIESNRGRTVLVGRAKKIRDLAEKLPDPIFQDESGPYGYLFRRY